MNQKRVDVSSSIEDVAELIQSSKCITVLTGAGISTPSGVPDFRSEGTGLWTKVEPMEVASLNAFRYQPERFYHWIGPLFRHIWTAEPNPAHQGIARLENAGYVKTVITQNIDGLHQKAGSRNVLEVHGSFQSLTCGRCFITVSILEYIDCFLDENRIPTCIECGGILKPNVILFGEQLPITIWNEAEKASQTCDLMIVVGSSLEVLPVASLPMQSIDRGAHLVIINRSPTYLYERADVVILADAADVIPAIVTQVL